MRDSHVTIIVWALCSSLVIATGGIVVLMFNGVSVAAPVSLAVAAQWGAMLAVLAKGRKSE